MEEHLRPEGRLFLIPTPLGDEGAEGCLTAGGIDTVRGLRHFAVENARTARRFLSTLGMPCAIDELQMGILDKRTAREGVQPFVAWLAAGLDVGVLSEAGAPGIADPGALLVRVAHEHGVEVVPLVGPSSLLMAMMASGLNGQSFAFVGYLPIEKRARRARIRELETKAIREGSAQAFIETPYRNDQLLHELLATLRAETRLCLGCGLQHQGGWVRTLPVAEWFAANVTLGKVPTLYIIGV